MLQNGEITSEGIAVPPHTDGTASDSSLQEARTLFENLYGPAIQALKADFINKSPAPGEDPWMGRNGFNLSIGSEQGKVVKNGLAAVVATIAERLSTYGGDRVREMADEMRIAKGFTELATRAGTTAQWGSSPTIEVLGHRQYATERASAVPAASVLQLYKVLGVTEPPITSSGGLRAGQEGTLYVDHFHSNVDGEQVAARTDTPAGVTIVATRIRHPESGGGEQTSPLISSITLHRTTDLPSPL